MPAGHFLLGLCYTVMQNYSDPSETPTTVRS